MWCVQLCNNKISSKNHTPWQLDDWTVVWTTVHMLHVITLENNWKQPSKKPTRGITLEPHFGYWVVLHQVDQVAAFWGQVDQEPENSLDYSIVLSS